MASKAIKTSPDLIKSEKIQAAQLVRLWKKERFLLILSVASDRVP